MCDVGLLQGQTEESLRQHLMNLLSDKASYEAAAKVQLDVTFTFLWLLKLIKCYVYVTLLFVLIFCYVCNSSESVRITEIYLDNCSEYILG